MRCDGNIVPGVRCDVRYGCIAVLLVLTCAFQLSKLNLLNVETANSISP